MDISFDSAKREATLQERGLDMADAAEIFAGPTLIMLDDRADYGEDRYIAFGLMDGRMVVCVYTDREATRRIISLRKANEREQTKFGERLR
jgi:uncharacterized DUF497 family protein